MRWPSGTDQVIADRRQPAGIHRVGVYEGAIGGPERVASLAALFPATEFATLDQASGDAGAFDVVIIAMLAEKAPAAAAWLKSLPSRTRAVIVLHEADVLTTRQLIREGAADVIPAPASEPSLALSLERLLSAPVAAKDDGAEGSQVVALLKAAGGVGATSLGVQAAALLAARGQGQVFYADLDLQNGAAAAYLDLPDALSVLDTLGAADSLADTPFATALAEHRSGLRLLAAPHELVSLEAISPGQVAPLLDGLRRGSALTLVDLPGAWLAWTREVLMQADRIVLVTQLTVPHVQMMNRQLQLLERSGVTKPIVLVCNNVSREHQASLSQKAAERALGRPFDVVVPQDIKTMAAALNQGVELTTVKRGTAVEKAIAVLADKLSDGVLAPAKARRW